MAVYTTTPGTEGYSAVSVPFKGLSNPQELALSQLGRSIVLARQSERRRPPTIESAINGFHFVVPDGILGEIQGRVQQALNASR